MAKKNGVKKAIKAAASGGITRQEFNNIVDQYNVSPQSVVQKADKINKKAKSKGGTPFVSLNSGAANMLIKQASNVSSPFSQPSFGTGRIGRTLQGMMGTPASSGTYIKGQPVGATAGTPSTLMIGGTQIRPGGRVANQGFGSSPRATGIPASAPTEPVNLGTPDPIRKADPSTRAAGEARVDAMRAAVDEYQNESTPTYTSESPVSTPSIDGMTGGGMGISGATGLRRPNSRWRQQRRTSKGTNNFRRSLQIGSSINLA